MTIFWRVVGVALFLWAAWDIYFGYTLLYDVIYRNQEPVLYWVTVSGWIVLGVSCFFSSE
jgi:hypothetical protein